MKAFNISSIPPRKISGVLVAAVILLNVVAVMMTVIGVREIRNSGIRNAETNTQNLALAVDLSVSNQIRNIDLVLRAVVTGLVSRDLRSLENSRQSLSFRELFVAHRSFLRETEGWSIADAEGKVILVDNNPNPEAISIRDREYFAELKANEEDNLVISKPLVSKISGNQVLVLARAVRNKHREFLGAVIIPLPIAHFGEALSEFAVGAGGYLTIRDKDLGFIVRAKHKNDNPSVADPPIGDKTLSSELLDLVRSGVSKGSYQGSRPFDGSRHVASFRVLDTLPLVVTASIAEDHYLIEWNETTRRFSGFLALFLFVGNGAGILLHRLLRTQHRDARLLKESNERLESSLTQLSEQDKALIAAQEAGGLGTYTLDLTSGTWTTSSKLREIAGIATAERFSLEESWQLVHPEDRKSLRSYFRDEVLIQRKVFDREYRIVRHCDGVVLWVHNLGKTEFDNNGLPVRISGTMQDISRRRLADERLRLTNQVFQSTSEGILVIDTEGKIIETNPAFSKITGYSCDEVKGRTPEILNSGVQDQEFYRTRQQTLLESGSWEGETINHRKDGSLYVQYSRFSAIRDGAGKIGYFCGVISDITQLKESQRRLEYLAYHDELTGLTNRVLLTDRMQQAMAQCRRRAGKHLGLCYIDLDNFKAINDRWGHEAGDSLLREIAQRLKRCTRSGDTVARLGGDEFVVLFCNLNGENEVETVVSRLMNSVSQAYEIEGTRFSATISVGVSIYPNEETDEPDALLRHADQAMYEAKRSGKNRMQYFDLQSERRSREHQHMYSRLVDALARQELRLHYQPKVDLRSGLVIGVEALVRWQNPEHGLMQPGQFLPAIETTELTLPVGEWILHEALQQRRRWRDEGINLPVSVNIFALHLQRRDFADRLEQILGMYPDLDPGDLELEVLETTALEDIEQIAVRLEQCMRLGVCFSLDDFGTGFSSLTYLRQLPAGTVKIDRSFVREILDDPADEALVQGIVGIAHTLGRKVVAEGVETLEHGVPLLRCGCNWAQGYGIAKPMPADQIGQWMAFWEKPDIWETVAPPELLFFRNYEAD